MSVTLWIDNHDGLGFVDYSKFWTDVVGFTSARKNEPVLFDLNLFPVDDQPGWVTPTRGAYIKVEDANFLARDVGITDGVIYTGYLTDDPNPALLGSKGGQTVWGYQAKATSDDYLLNLRYCPIKVYVNKTHGEILRDLAEMLVPTASPVVLDYAGIQSGGTELLYQVDPRKKWGEIAQQFAEVDGYVYFAMEGCVFYQPEESPWSASPFVQNAHLEVSLDDPRFLAANLRLDKKSTTIVNDVTVVGLDEPRSPVRECFLSDGYKGEHRLRKVPYGVTEQVFLTEDFTSDSINATTWLEEDDPNLDYIQATQGALNIVGGSGVYGGAYLISRKGIELWGLIETRDGELYFPPSPSGQGFLGGLYTSAVPLPADLWAGWQVNATNAANIILTPYGPAGAIGSGIVLKATDHNYILRKQILVDRLPAMTARRAPYPAGLVDPYFRDIPTAGGVVIAYSVEDIDWTDPSSVVKTTRVVATYQADITPATPQIALYSPISSLDLHSVLNFVEVKRPSQVYVTVDGVPIRVGSYLDGGRCAIVEEGEQAKLAWYAVPGATGTIDSYYQGMLDDQPMHYYRFNGADATSIDEGPLAVSLTKVGTVDSLAGGVPDEPTDGAISFSGAGRYDATAAMRVGMGTGLVGDVQTVQAFTIECLVNTANADNRTPIFDCRNGTLGVALYLMSGTPKLQLLPGSGAAHTLAASQVVNSGTWRHVAFTVSGVVGSALSAKVYIDGLLDAFVGDFGWFSGWSTALYLPGSFGYSLMALEPGDLANVYGACGLDEFAIYAGELSSSQIAEHAKRGKQEMPAVTVPPQGAEIAVAYRERAKARARVQSPLSIADEAQKFGDDGLRQRIVGESDVTPPPRTSEECLEVARAILADSSPGWVGSYTVVALEHSPTELVLMPRPGDRVQVVFDVAGDPVDIAMPITNVSAVFEGVGAYSYALEFGDVNRLDIVTRELYRLRKSSLLEAKLDDITIFEDDTVEGVYPPTDLPDPAVVSITETSVTVTFGASLPAGVSGVEIRRSDSGWGSDGFLSRTASATMGLTRAEEDQTWYFKSYIDGTPRRFAERAALVRVTYPLANTIILSGIDGDISSTRCRVRVPYPKATSFAGIQVRFTSASGQIVYEGDGVNTRKRMSTLTCLIEDGRFVVDVPNPLALTSMTFWLCAYNLRNAYGPGTTAIIDTIATEMVWDPITGTWVLVGPGGTGMGVPTSMPSQRFLGRNSAGTGGVEILTCDTAKTMLKIPTIIYLGGSRFHAVRMPE